MYAQIAKIILKVALGTTGTAAGSTLVKHAAKELEVLLKGLK